MANLAITDLDPRENASVASSSSSALTTTSSSHYEVFINHRGPDVKNTFVSHLYRALIHHGLRVFLDREEMEKGDNISSQIEHAICGASVHVAIFSPRYAESRWCLDELVLMKNSRGTILPVFFKVDPSVLRWTRKDGAYAKALRDLEQKTTHDSRTGEERPRYSSDTIKKWRNALSYAADLSGFMHGDEDDEGELLDNVVQWVLSRVPNTPLDVATYATGLGEKLQDFEKTVLSQGQDENSAEAKVVGIVGVGGVGKTTLAKEFFNSRRSDYDSSSFLFDVRETARTMSLAYLQSKLLRDLKHTDIKIDNRDEGIEKLKRYLSSCHALIILDDVNDMDQLEAVLPIKKILRPDSLILVTSRESSIYIMKGLNTPHSKELFCCYAFHQPDPIPEFADLVDQIVKACDGLPLSLKVFGAQVFGENERSVWQEILDDLHKILPTAIHDRLKISYDLLGPEVKVIFLDISCFFLGEDGDKAIRIWGKLGVRNLQDRCLLEVDSENKIKMHDHIRDMGRKIAEEGSIPRRIWHSMTNIIDDLFLQSSHVITVIRGIKMLSSSSDPFQNKDINPYSTSGSSDISPSIRLEMKHLFSNFNFPGMRNLQLVATEEDYLEDIMRRVQPPHLIWLRWYRCSHSSLPHWIPMGNLRVLEIEGHSLNIPWPHQSQAVPLQLRELNIWAPLLDIPKSIGLLKYLESISIWNYSEALTLKRLPNEFCHLRSLKYLVLKRFSRIVSLPDNFGDLTNLQHIDLEGASSLQMLPNSFGNLTRLRHLSLSGCENLTISNRTLGTITSLEYLNFSACKQLKELPPQVAHQRPLQKLYLEGTNLKELPDGIGDLCNLEVLELGSDLLEALPLSLGELKSLKVLSLSHLLRLKCLPDSIGQLTQLADLKIEHCGIEYLPQELLKMHNLKVLEVIDCALGEHPFKKNFQGGRETFLSSEEERCMFGVERFSIAGTKLRDVFFEEGVCPHLQHMYCTRGCYGLEQQFTKLRRLNVYGCREIRELPGVENFTSLEELDVMACEKLQSIQGLGQLTKLLTLNVSGCPEIRELGLGQLTKLRRPDVFGCREMQELLGVEHLISLETLCVMCEKLQSIKGLGQLTKLQTLLVGQCCKIQELSGVEQLTSLETMNVWECENLRELYVYGCHEIRELPGVEHSTSLKWLDV